MKDRYRNEILEIGQTVLLYYDGSWSGHINAYGTLSQLLSQSPKSINETWSVILPGGGMVSWSMFNLDRVAIPDDTSEEIPF